MKSILLCNYFKSFQFRLGAASAIGFVQIFCFGAECCLATRCFRLCLSLGEEMDRVQVDVNQIGTRDFLVKLTCQLCTVGGHEAYQCSHLYYYYHEAQAMSALPNMLNNNYNATKCDLSSEIGFRHKILLYDDSSGYFICQYCFLHL